MFHYSSYWGTWSRILSNIHQGGRVVEVNLTPTNVYSCGQKGWDDEVAGIRIRVHGTKPDRGDQFAEELPERWVLAMLKHLPPETVGILLHGDILPLIDFEKHKKVNNGGANLADCRFECSAKVFILMSSFGYGEMTQVGQVFSSKEKAEVAKEVLEEINALEEESDLIYWIEEREVEENGIAESAARFAYGNRLPQDAEVYQAEHEQKSQVRGKAFH